MDPQSPKSSSTLGELNRLAPPWASRMQLVGAIGLAVLGIVFIVIGATSGGGVALGIGVAGLALGLMNLVQVLTRRSKGT